MMAVNVAVTGMSCLLGSEKCSIFLCIDPVKYDLVLRSIEQETSNLFRVEKILAVAIKKALDDAGIRITKKNAHRCAILIDNAYGIEEFKVQSFISLLKKEASKTFLVPYSSANVLAAKMSILFNIQGPSLTFSSGSLPGMSACFAGIDLLRDKRSDIVIVVGVNFFCKDLDRAFKRSGFRQESCAVLILEDSQRVEKAGRPAHGKIMNIKRSFYHDPKKEALGRSRLGSSQEVKRHQGSILLSFSCSLFNRCPAIPRFSLDPKLRKRSVILENVFGNTFSSAGALGVIWGLCAFYHRMGEDPYWQSVSTEKKRREFLFIDQDAQGHYASMIIKESNPCSYSSRQEWLRCLLRSEGRPRIS